jgi:hypothetical protein
MKTNKTPAETTATRTACYLATSRYGTAAPEIVVECPAGTSYRLVMVELHRLAAEIELATLEVKGEWLVQIEQMGNARGRVYLEMVTGDAKEMDRAMVALKSVGA